MNKEMLDIFKGYVKEHYLSKDIAHNFEHIERIIKTSNKIVSYSTYDNLKESLLIFLMCFHGLNRKLESDENFKRSTINFLTNQKWSSKDITKAFESLKRHCKAPQKIEENIVHDANFIEVVGAFGLARAFNSAGTRGQSIDEITSILKKEYYSKIQCKTHYGKIIYEERKQFAEKFLAILNTEMEWYKY